MPPVPRMRSRAPAFLMLGLALAGLFVASCGGGSPCAAATPVQALPPSIAELLRDFQESRDLPGVALAAHDGGRLLAGASGVRSRTSALPLQARDRFLIASLTKSFTAALTLLHARTGRIALDAPVTRYVPAPPSDAITVRHLLNHTSGIPDLFQNIFLWAILSQPTPTAVLEPAEVVKVALAEPPVFPPGSQQSYSNTGYIILGQILEAVAGEGYGALLERRIACPLGLPDTALADPATPDPLLVRGHPADEPPGFDFTVYPTWLSAAWSAAGMISTAPDVALWYHTLFQGNFLRPAERASMLALVPDSGYGPIEGFGFSLAALRTPLGRAWVQTGRIRGFAAYAAHWPDPGLTVVALTNTDRAALGTLVQHVAAALLAREAGER